MSLALPVQMPNLLGIWVGLLGLDGREIDAPGYSRRYASLDRSLWAPDAYSFAFCYRAPIVWESIPERWPDVSAVVIFRDMEGGEPTSHTPFRTWRLPKGSHVTIRPGDLKVALVLFDEPVGIDAPPKRSRTTNAWYRRMRKRSPNDNTTSAGSGD